MSAHDPCPEDANQQAEFSRLIKVRPLPADMITLDANQAECAALAERFGIIAIDQMTAEITLQKTEQGIAATGRLGAQIKQACAVSGEDFEVNVSDTLDLLFVGSDRAVADPEFTTNEEGAIEVDLFASESEEIRYEGDTFDLGEAIAQTLGLAIDPYAEGPNADEARKKANLSDEATPAGPLAEALAALKKG